MKDLSGTNPELIEEISALEQKIQDLKHSDSEHKPAEVAYDIAEDPALYAARETAGPEDSTHPPLSTALPSVPVNPDPEETASLQADANVFSGLTLKHRTWLFVPGALITMILLLVLLWPALYHYEAVRLDGKDYPLRINRLTTHAQYFDGRQWLEPSSRFETPLNVPPEIASPSLPAQPTGAGIRNEPKPASPPPAKQEITPRDQISVNTKTGAPYSIQVSAYPARSEAETSAKEMRAKKFAVRVEAVSVQGKGRWYRVLLGQFKTRAAALQYLRDHRIGETYPGSFVQKTIIQ